MSEQKLPWWKRPLVKEASFSADLANLLTFRPVWRERKK